MASRMKRIWGSLDLEERIINGAALLALLSVFFPWMSGEWLGGDTVTYSGFGSYTSFIGLTVFLLLLALVLVTLVPLFGGPILLKKRHRELVRLLIATQATILSIAALSVLMKVTYEFSRVEIRFGMYMTLIGCIITSIYTFLRFEGERLAHTKEVFHHPEDRHPINEKEESTIQTPPPPPPPPPPPLEEHHHIRR